MIAGYARSPFHFAHNGDLKRVRADELAAQVVRGLLEKTGVEARDLEDLIVGCAFPEGEQGLNVARLIAFLSDLPLSVAGMTINRFCGSSMQSVHVAAGAIQMNAGEAFLCAGVESMSRVPMSGFNPLPHPGLAEQMPRPTYRWVKPPKKKYKLSRGRQEAMAVGSHRKAAAARGSGNLSNEIIAIRDGNHVIDVDGCIRDDTCAEALAGLKPAFLQGGSVTAGTSSPLTDGAAAVLVTSEDYAKAHGLKPIARLRSVAVAGCAPESWASARSLRRRKRSNAPACR